MIIMKNAQLLIRKGIVITLKRMEIMKNAQLLIRKGIVITLKRMEIMKNDSKTMANYSLEKGSL